MLLLFIHIGRDFCEDHGIQHCVALPNHLVYRKGTPKPVVCMEPALINLECNCLVKCASFFDGVYPLVTLSGVKQVKLSACRGMPSSSRWGQCITRGVWPLSAERPSVFFSMDVMLQYVSAFGSLKTSLYRYFMFLWSNPRMSGIKQVCSWIPFWVPIWFILFIGEAIQ